MSRDKDLREYRKKRDPLKTSEPFSAERPASGGNTQWGRFVVHLHDATRLHYDLRLQVGGVLKSFPVPKGPSLNPDDRRLAIQTEDHPLEYLDFEDVIAEGNYGAGAMIVWDTGIVRYLERSPEEGLASGKVDFWLEGYKLRGRFALVETTKRAVAKGIVKTDKGQRHWLLIKKKDAFSQTDVPVIEAAPASVLSGLTVEELAHKPRLTSEVLRQAEKLGEQKTPLDEGPLTPMLCATEGAELDSPDRLYELKLDGVRVLLQRKASVVNLRYRSRRAVSGTYPEITAAARFLIGHDLLLDGEIVAFDVDGRPSFQRLGARIHARRADEVARAQREVPVVYLVFDILQFGGYDLRNVPLSSRKELLTRVVPRRGPIQLLDHIAQDGQALFDLCRSERLEGVVAKRASSLYRPGPQRTDDWVKIKCERDDDFVVIGWERKVRSRPLGSLWLGSYDEGRVFFRGKVGSGLTLAATESLLSVFKERGTRLEDSVALGVEGPFKLAKDVHFVEPSVVVKVRYLGWTDAGALRHPVFLGARDDVAPEACSTAPLLDASTERALSAEETDAPQRATTSSGRVHLTNQRKVFWPEEGVTKGDVVAYYAAISHVMLPFLRGRPIMLVRYPDGIAGKSFYQWRVPAGAPDWIRGVRVRDEERDGKDVVTFVIDDMDGLLYIANLGCIPVHILASTEEALGSCTFLTVDFDLKGAPFEHAVDLALTLREVLDELGLSGYPKTSGQTGLHVLIPMNPAIPFETARLLCELLGRVLQARKPEISTLERRIERRKGRVYIDTGQTGRSRTIVAPYSVRAAPGATVSTPLHWEELSRALDPAALTLFTVPERIDQRGDPLSGFQEAPGEVSLAVQKLAALLHEDIP